MRWKGTLAYDGTSFDGWQSQPGGNTIQDRLEARLKEVFSKRVVICGSGRTDSGVHARAQVFHFDADWSHGSKTLLKALRPGLPESICLYSMERASESFHARFSATGKRYVYQYFEGLADPFETRWYWSTKNHRLDDRAMQKAADHLVGKYDFRSFAANPKDDRGDDTVKDLRRLEVLRDGPRIHLIAEADGFLYRMVRSLAGCLYDVGIGKLDPDSVAEIRDKQKRTHAVRTSPPTGLFLDTVWY